MRKNNQNAYFGKLRFSVHAKPRGVIISCVPWIFDGQGGSSPQFIVWLESNRLFSIEALFSLFLSQYQGARGIRQDAINRLRKIRYFWWDVQLMASILIFSRSRRGSVNLKLLVGNAKQ